MFKEHSMQLIQCLANNDAIALVNIESDTSLAMAMNGTQIRNLNKALTKKDIIKSISFFIHRFNDSFNANGKFNDMQIATVAMDLYDVFAYESLEDVMLMFKFARQGKIGDGRDFKLDSQTIFHKWVPQYLELKSIEREKNHIEGQGNYNGTSNFKWKKEDVDKLKVSTGKEKIKGSTYGQRIKEVFNTDHLKKPVSVITNRTDYMNTMYLEVRRQPIESLKNYILSQNKDDPTFDEDVFKLVETEIDRRNKKG